MSPVIEDAFLSGALALLRSIAEDLRALREHLAPDTDTEGTPEA